MNQKNKYVFVTTHEGKKPVSSPPSSFQVSSVNLLRLGCEIQVYGKREGGVCSFFLHLQWLYILINPC